MKQYLLFAGTETNKTGGLHGFAGDFDTPRFALGLARKDIGLATELGREMNVPMPMANLAEQTMIEAMQRGWAGKDSSASFLIQEERAGVQVRGSKAD